MADQEINVTFNVIHDLKPGERVLVATQKELDTEQATAILNGLQRQWPDINWVVLVGVQVRRVGHG